MAVSPREPRRLTLAAMVTSGVLVVFVVVWLGLWLATGIHPSGRSAAIPPTVAPSQAAPSPQPSPSSTPPAPPQTRAVIPLGRAQIHVPILMYHYLRVVTNPNDVLGFNLSVTPASFAAQMDWLANNGYHPITFDDMRAYFQGQAVLPSRPIVLTFDDGYQDFYTTAEPILRAHGFKAVAYIITGFWSWPGYMTPHELVQLDRSGQVEIASHTVDHPNLVNASATNLNYELQTSKSMLEHLLGHSVLDFNYPSGRFNAVAIAAVANAEYVTAVTELPGMVLGWSSRLTWPRVRVSGGEALSTYAARLGPAEPTIEQPVVSPPVLVSSNPKTSSTGARVTLNWGPRGDGAWSVAAGD